MRELATIVPYYRPYRTGMALGIVMVILAQAFSLVSPYLIKLVIDSLEDPA